MWSLTAMAGPLILCRGPATSAETRCPFALCKVGNAPTGEVDTSVRSVLIRPYTPLRVLAHASRSEASGSPGSHESRQFSTPLMAVWRYRAAGSE